MNKGVLISLWDPIFSSFGWIPRSDIAGSYGNSVFNFLRNLLLLSIVTAPFYTVNRHWKCQLSGVTISLHPCQHLLFSFLFKIYIMAILIGVGDTSLWFWFTFPWWLVILSIFSNTSWPFLCLHGRNVYSSPFPIA